MQATRSRSSDGRTAQASRRVVSLSADSGLSGAEVGFKAARLVELLRLGLPVPEAVAVTVAAFDEFCAANGIGAVDRPGAATAERIAAGSMPPALAAELARALDALPHGTFAVRSSAVAEDGQSFSMAGQLTTYLDVPKEDVPRRVKACWAALYGRNVAAYRARHEIADPGGMGVVVQHQIAARYSGVLFTLDPVTRAADHFVVEWVEGPGEQLVSGSVTPDRIYLDRRRPVIPDAVPTGLRQILARLAECAGLVERHCGCPVDIEWCADGAGLHLLQARPITAVTGRQTVAWTNTNMSENFPDPLTPFAWSVVDEFYTRYIESLVGMLGVRDPALRNRHSAIGRLTGVQGGRVYYNISSWYELLRRYVPGCSGAFRRFLDHYIGQTVPVESGPEDRAAPPARPAGGMLYPIIFWSRLTFFLSRGRQYVDRFQRRFAAYRKELRRPPYDELPLGAVMRKLDLLFEEFVARHWYPQCIADLSVLLFPGILDVLIRRWVPTACGDPDQVATRLLRHVEMESTDAAAIIQRMAGAIGEHDSLPELLEAGRYGELEAALPEVLRDLLGEFMERFGSRCYRECMIVSPTFEERPDLFWDLVRQYRRTEQAPAGPRRLGRTAVRADALDEVLPTLPFGRRLVMRLVVGRARRAIALREQGRLVQSLLFGEIRRLAHALGRKLVALGHLQAVDDVFYLHLPELRDLCRGKFLLPETLPHLVAMRRSALARCGESEPPECVLLPEGVYHRTEGRRRTLAGEGALCGVGASGGTTSGRARIILDPTTDGRLEPGDILVTRSTDPGWTPLFLIAGGLVLERGGMLSHGAIVAREFGIPAVIGIAGATRLIHDGDRVRVDGDTGEVVVLARAEDEIAAGGSLGGTGIEADRGQIRDRKSA